MQKSLNSIVQHFEDEKRLIENVLNAISYTILPNTYCKTN